MRVQAPNFNYEKGKNAEHPYYKPLDARHGVITNYVSVALEEYSSVTTNYELERSDLTFIPDDDEQQFWLDVSDRSLAKVWENTEDDVYAELL